MIRYNKEAVVGVFLPIMCQKENNKEMAENEELEKRTPTLGFLEYLGEGVIIVDSERIIRAINSALVRILGWREAELIGKRCLDIFQCQQPLTNSTLCQNLCPLLKLFPKKTSISTPVVYQDISIATKSGERREVSASFAPLELPILSMFANASNSLSAGEVTATAPSYHDYSIIVLRDVTEQKRQERIKTEFVATASHQLRTPLSSIKTSINILVDNVGDDLSPPLLRLLQNIRSSSVRMERLVNDLIELTNLQSGRVQLQRRYFEASQLIEKAVELNRERLEVRQHTLKLKLLDGPLYVQADYGRISQVLGHLISNAIKFSAATTPIELAIESGELQEVIFSVRDEGIGIEPDEQGLIFEKFYQSQVTENAEEVGGGLGLPLAKALVELNGGRLWLGESTPGKGSTFYFSLPAAPKSTL